MCVKQPYTSVVDKHIMHISMCVKQPYTSSCRQNNKHINLFLEYLLGSNLAATILPPANPDNPISCPQSVSLPL